MDTAAASFALAAKLVLAATFAVSATRKVVLGLGAGAALLVRLGLGRRAASTLAVATPVVEGLLAVGLVALPGSPIPAAACIVALVVFTAFVIFTFDADAPCPCFGGSRSSTSGRTILRNGVLTGLAVLATGSVAGAGAVTILAVGLLGVVVFAVVTWADRPVRTGAT